MTELVLTLSRFSLASERSDAREFAMTREIAILGAVLVLLQVLDGVLTAVGVYRFGLAAEANLFIRCVMEHIGVVSALVILKSFAIGIVALLCMLATRVQWLPKAMKVMVAVYLVAAVIPWTAILFSTIA